MTPTEIIEALKSVKAFEPRVFIVAACDAAIEYIVAHEPAVVDAPAVDASATTDQSPVDPTADTGTKSKAK